MQGKVYTVYSNEGDMTFIMEEEGNRIEVKGFYFGEPDEELTKQYYGDLVAYIE